MIFKLKRNNSATTKSQPLQASEIREEFISINSFFMNLLCEKKCKSNYKRYQKEYLDLGTKLYYLASQNTFNKYLEFKSMSLYVEGSDREHKIVLLWFAELNMLLRNDLGLETNPEFIKDYLNLMLSYWNKDELSDEDIEELNEQLTKTVDNYTNWGNSM
jgi:hypothetical protein